MGDELIEAPPSLQPRRRGRGSEELIQDLADQVATARKLHEVMCEKANAASGARREYLLRRGAVQMGRDRKASTLLATMAPGHPLVSEV